MTGPHLYAFIPLVVVILLLAWIAMTLHAGEDPPARGPGEPPAHRPGEPPPSGREPAGPRDQAS